mmetsp:Transcript_6339/g.7156  ORF Transcript_6339/g.7156 Transcript_6339/m.7156 type:complete len:91 (-) Transcript_6339:309-581(-)
MLHHATFMLTLSFFNMQHSEAYYVPAFKPPKDYYIDLSITFKDGDIVVLKRKKKGSFSPRNTHALMNVLEASSISLVKDVMLWLTAQVER